MKPIKLKYQGRYIKALQEALTAYIESFNHIDRIPAGAIKDNMNDLIYFSIASDLYYRTTALLNKRYASKSYTLSMELHHSLVLLIALTWHLRRSVEKTITSSYIETVKNDLFQKIINLTPENSEQFN